MVPAEHTSIVDMTEMKPDGRAAVLDGGAAVGYVIEFENGFKIYHTGDTDVFGDMALIGRFYKPDLALVCIGGHFTMDPEDAAFAMREYIRPKQVIPMHYGTFPGDQPHAGRIQGGARQCADQDARRETRRAGPFLVARCPPSRARRRSASRPPAWRTDTSM